MLKVNEKELLSLDLQFFAEDNNDNTDNKDKNNDGTNDSNKDSGGSDDKVEFTKDDITKLIQSEVDKVRTDYSKKLKDKDKELDTLKREKMTEEEKQKLDNENLLKENEALKKDKLGYFALENIVSQGLPAEAKEFVVGDDEATTLDKITAFKTMFDNAVTAKVNEAYKNNGSDHKKGNSSSGSITKEQFMSMSAVERTKIYNENPELYKQLMK
ncbi:DUF4355 domain-containing protein [Metabacillus litoralis]|uniref:capsid assembly scaffolding protein Gp46 family protein n=1 Tax=Metabacillus litoralis TaxID=152268 RepID=UPI0020413F2C|nr:DUF4355 domain-containing protein [Metabacillus litoralis]MCM3160994.1 DUF4355 domain-containing protein [Metabacillus litoralis]